MRSPSGVRMRVADLDLALLEDGLGEVRCGVALGAPGGGGQHACRASPRTAQICPPGCSTRSRGSSRISRRNCCTYPAPIQAAPSRASISPGVRSRRDDLAQRGGVDLEPRVVERRPASAARELGADVAGQVLRRRDQPPGCRVVEDQGAELLAGVVLGGAEQPGDLAEVGLAAGVQADGQRVGRGVGAQPRAPGAR